MSVLTLVAAGCGSSGHSSNGAQSATNAASIPDAVPPNTTLRVADQLQILELELGNSGNDRAFPYRVQYSSFVGGPPMLQAFNAGAVDIGYVADTPLIFAQAAHQDVVAVAGWASQHGADELIATPGSGINSWRDLKGKKLAYQQGTVLEAVALQGLHNAGLSLHDVKSVSVPVTQIAATLQSGSVDAGILAPPLDSAYLAQHPGAHVVDRPDDITDRASFIIASKRALANPGKAAAIRDYVQRLAHSYKWISAHPDAWAQAFYVGQYHLSLAAGKQLMARSGPVSFLDLPGDLAGPQQTLADLYHDANEIPEKLDAVKEFDGRFADAIRAASQ